MGVVFWWAVLLIGELVWFVWAAGWAWLADLVSARERRTLQQLDQQLEARDALLESSATVPMALDPDQWWRETGPRKAS
jgi:hypothetical protein